MTRFCSNPVKNNTFCTPNNPQMDTKDDSMLLKRGADWRGERGDTRFPKMAGLQNVFRAVAVHNLCIISCIILVAMGPKVGFVDPPAGMPKHGKKRQYRRGV